MMMITQTITTMQTRARNGVNEYQTIDPDGPGGPLAPVNLAPDANGNLTLDTTARNLSDGEGGVPGPSGQIYEYDEENRLVAVKRASDDATLLTIAYDAVGRRVASADYLAAGDPCTGPPALTRHIFAGVETIEEHLSCDSGENFSLAREFVWGDRFPQPVALVAHGGMSGGFGGPSVPPGETVYHYLHDVLGSVVALVDAGDAQANPPVPPRVVERYTYDPYGKTVIEETNPATVLPTARLEASALGNPFAWTGQRYDAGVRLYHFLFRGYSPSLGRWLQRDPAGQVHGINLYEYVGSSPVVWVDVLGLQRGGRADDNTPPTAEEIVGKYICEKVFETALKAAAVRAAKNAASKSGMPPGQLKAVGAGVSGLFQVLDAATIWQQAQGHATGPAKAIVANLLKLHVEMCESEKEDCGPNESGVGKVPFKSGACGWCTYTCDCNEDGSSGAIVLCTGGQLNCNGRASFDNPWNNPCTLFCEQQRCADAK